MKHLIFAAAATLGAVAMAVGSAAQDTDATVVAPVVGIVTTTQVVGVDVSSLTCGDLQSGAGMLEPAHASAFVWCETTGRPPDTPIPADAETLWAQVGAAGMQPAPTSGTNMASIGRAETVARPTVTQAGQENQTSVIQSGDRPDSYDSVLTVPLIYNGP